MIFRENGAPTLEQFLAEFWQKKPCLLRQALPQFAPELDENDVAGLACEDMAEARLVSGSYPQQDWQVRHGPFSARELRKLPARDWTLLVQDVDKHYPPLARLLSEFDFLPTWRLDDLMVSVAAPGGSVGPHYDEYDVFLLQARGKRRWQIATQFDHRLLEDCELKVLASFTPEREWVLAPGDLLYLPPGIAHHGIALGPADDCGEAIESATTCMTWSIGMRAPSQADLLQALGEWLAERCDEGERYRDLNTDLGPQLRPGEITPAAAAALRDLMARALVSPGHLNAFLGHFLSRYRLAQQPAPPPTLWSADAVAALLAKPHSLQRNPWTRLAWIEQGGRALLFAAGDEYECDVDTARGLCATPLSLPADAAALQLACQLLNDGHLYAA
jgi:50S ribosomal protein L16 3-hydroxylase